MTTYLWIQPELAKSISKEVTSGLLKGNNNQVLGIIPQHAINNADLNTDNVIGIYQTTPLENTPKWDDVFVLIIPQFKAWHVKNGRVKHIELVINHNRPNIIETQNLSNAQKTAIIISSILALTLMIALSIYLLPPAPPIP